MSGSGGGISGSDILTPCDNLKFTTDLASPKAAAMSLEIGDILEITLNGDALVVMYDGEIVGGIACKESSRLRFCLSQGNSYKASVLTKNLGQIKISVYPG
ncbi:MULTISPECIES: hypothetical protein [Pantoea]|uniref:hypothetical protein n=1 Tax=Pantoea TaxID=53335 RepID=UPI0008FF5DA1|nr:MULTISPECIES: hypothetical protein [Pantoea]